MANNPKTKWKDIATAPKDGTLILVIWDGIKSLASWDTNLGEWVYPLVLPHRHRAESPTCWMLFDDLPPPPSEPKPALTLDDFKCPELDALEGDDNGLADDITPGGVGL